MLIRTRLVLILCAGALAWGGERQLEAKNGGTRTASPKPPVKSKQRSPKARQQATEVPSAYLGSKGNYKTWQFQQAREDSALDEPRQFAQEVFFRLLPPDAAVVLHFSDLETGTPEGPTPNSERQLQEGVDRELMGR